MLLSAFSSNSFKEPVLTVEGTVLHYGKPVNGAVVIIFLDKKKADQIITSRNGRFSATLKYQKEYIIEISKQGLVTKKIIVSTQIPGHVMAIGGVTEGFTDLIIPMLERIPGMNTEPFNEPVTRFIFDEPTWLFVKDEEHTKKVAPGITPIINKLDELRMQAYRDQIHRGDSLMEARDYEAAYMAYKNSEKYTDDIKYSKDQLKKAYKAIKKRTSTKEEYEKAIALGDASLENENFAQAVDYYEKARMYDPEETYAVQKIEEIDSINNRFFLEKKVAFDIRIATADSLNDAGNYIEAGKYYREAVNIFPDEQSAISKMEDNDEAISKHPVNHNKEDRRKEIHYMALLSTGDSLLEIKQYDLAEQKYLEAQKLNVQDAYPGNKLDEIAKLKLMQKERERISRNKTEEIKEKEYRLIIDRADVYFQKGLYERSIEAYKKASEIKPDKPYPLGKINEANEILNQKTLASEQQASLTAKTTESKEIKNEDKVETPLLEPTEEIIPEGLNGLDTSFTREAHEKRVRVYMEELKTKKSLGDMVGQVKALRSLGEEFHLNNEINKAITYYEEALTINKDLGNENETSNILNDMAIAYYDSGRYETAVGLYIESYEINEKLGNKEISAELLDNIGQVYENTYNYENALKYYEKSLDVVEEINKKENAADLHNKIADVYYQQQDMSNAIGSYEKSLSIDRTLERKENIGVTLNNIGSAHFILGDYDKANEYFEQSFSAASETGDKKQSAISLNNLGNINYEEKKYNKAIDYYNRSLKIKKEIEDNKGVSVTLHNIGNTFRELKKENNAIDYYQQSIKMAKDIEYGEVVARNYKALAEVYASRKDYKTAYDFQRKYEDYRSSPSVSLRQITETQRGSELEQRDKTILSLRRQVKKQKLLAQYEAERRKKDLEIKNLEIKNKDASIKRQKLIIYSGILATLGLLSILLLIIRQNIIKRRTNRMLIQKNELISFQKQQITDSIKYASRIQKAMLPPSDYVLKIIPRHFILNKPRDIVSGDYYWTTQRGDESIIAVADCTGHGVPGAFMSMLGIAFLNQIVNKKTKATSSEILDDLRRHVIQQLHQKDKDAIARDGMDIALCIINEKERKLQYSGAHNPLLVVRKGELIEIKADKMPIGIGFFEKTEVPFKYHDMKLRKGDVIYIFSDGYADQFGSEFRKKFGIRRFKEILIEIHQKPMDEQSKILEKTIFEWKGDYEQIDDIMVMGVRIK